MFQIEIEIRNDPTNHKIQINCRRRNSLGIPHSPAKKELEHPAHFASTLRRDELGASMGSLRKENGNGNAWNRRDSFGSTNSLRKDFLQVPNSNRRNSRRLSSDSLDGRRNSWDPSRRGSSGSSGGWDSPIWEDKVENLKYWWRVNERNKIIVSLFLIVKN